MEEMGAALEAQGDGRWKDPPPRESQLSVPADYEAVWRAGGVLRLEELGPGVSMLMH